MTDPNCSRCGGTGSYETEGDLHKSGGMVPCYCEAPPSTWLTIAADALTNRMGAERGPSRRFAELMRARETVLQIQELVAQERRGPSSTERLRRIAQLVVSGR